MIKLTPKAYGCDEERYPLPIAAVDTHRPKPSSRRGSPVATPKVGSTPTLIALAEAVKDSDQPLPRSTASRDYFGEEAEKLLAQPRPAPSVADDAALVNKLEAIAEAEADAPEADAPEADAAPPLP